MNKWKDHFPIFQSRPGMTYLDSAATTLKPQKVIDKESEYYLLYSSNIHRGLYPIAEKASTEYEATRQLIAEYLHAQRSEEIVFTKGATEALNLLATSLSGTVITPGVEVLTTIVEHHANFVPWQQAASKNRAKFGCLTFQPLEATNTQIIEAFSQGITKETAVLALTHVSNALGLILPVKEIIDLARNINPKIIIVLDACQSIQHIPLNVQELDVDFLVFSGHKLFGPTGVGVLYGKYDRLMTLAPYQFGGDMIEEVGIDATTFAKVPQKFEAGTPPIAQVIGLGEAIRFVQSVGLKTIEDQTKKVRQYALSKLSEAFGSQIQLYTGGHTHFAGIVSFNIEGCHPHDVAQILGEQDICIRVGHHCAQPLHTFLNIPATCRASLSLYSEESEIDQLVSGLKNVLEVLHPYRQ